MGIFKFGLKMLKVDFKQCIFYLVSIIFSVSVIFNVFNIMYNSNFVSLKGDEAQTCTSLLFVVTIVAMVFTFFANSYFVMSKTKEMAIAALSGVSFNKLSILLCFQNLIIGVTGSLLGLLLGMGVAPLFLTIMYKALGTSGELWSFSKDSFITTFIIIIVQLFYAIYGDFMYVSNKEIKDLMNEKKQVSQPDTRVIKIPPIVYFIIYLIPLLMLFLDLKLIDPSPFAFMNVFFSLYAVQGVIRYYLPETILKLKKKKYFNDKIKLISLSNLHYSLRRSNFLIVTLSLITVTLVCVIIIFKDSPKIKILSVCSYVSVIILLAISIFYKILIEAVNRKYIFKQLKLIGYTTGQIKKIIKEEVTLFYGVAMGIPLIHMLVYLISFGRIGIISLSLAGALLGVFILVFGITAIVSYYVYKKLIFSYLWEVAK